MMMRSVAGALLLGCAASTATMRCAATVNRTMTSSQNSTKILCVCVCVFNRVCPTCQAISEGYESPMTVLVGAEPATPLLLRPKCLLLLLLC